MGAQGPAAAACAYQPCYCEENVFLLLQRLERDAPGSEQLERYAVFITNPRRAVPLWAQRASSQPDGLVLWDYHVIVLELSPSSHGGRPCGGAASPVSPAARVYDLDLRDSTGAGFPCALAEYTRLVLRPVRPEFARCLRVVPAAAFLGTFASDRSHMRAPDGSWSAPPPPYPPIVARDGATMNLPRFLDMGRDTLPLAAATSTMQQPAQLQLQHAAPSQPIAWCDVAHAAGSSRYGVVVPESVLLRCLLGGSDAGSYVGRTC